MKLRLVAGAAIAALACTAPTAATAQDATGATVKVSLAATIEAQDGGGFGGPVTGKPFGKGEAEYTVKSRGDRQIATYTATFKRGTIAGKATVVGTPVGGDGDLSYTGTLDVSKGTGDFKGVKAKGLNVTGGASGGVIKLKITGKANFPVTE